MIRTRHLSFGTLEEFANYVSSRTDLTPSIRTDLVEHEKEHFAKARSLGYDATLGFNEVSIGLFGFTYSYVSGQVVVNVPFEKAGDIPKIALAPRDPGPKDRLLSFIFGGSK